MALKPKTIADYRWIINNYINPYLGDLDIRELNLKVLNNFFYRLFVKGTGIRTIHYTHAVLRSALNYAQSLEIINSNKIKHVILPKSEQKAMHFLDQNQITRFLTVAKESPYFVLYLTTITTGLRISELLALKWEDIDFRLGTIRIRRQVKNLFCKNNEFSSLKTRNSLRTLPISSRLHNYLLEIKDKQECSKNKESTNWQNNELVFTSSVGTIVTYSHLRKDFKNILIIGGLPNLLLHDLRHTFATLLIEKGIPITMISKLLGHSKPSVTLDFYGHSTQHFFGEISDLFNNI